MHENQFAGGTGVFAFSCMCSRGMYHDPWVEAAHAGSNWFVINVAVVAGYNHVAATMNASLDEGQQ